MAALTQAGIKHPLVTCGLVVFAVAFISIGLAWPFTKDYFPALRTVVEQIATSPVAWFVVLIMGLTASFFLPRRYAVVSKTSVEPHQPAGRFENLRVLAGTVQPPAPKSTPPGKPAEEKSKPAPQKHEEPAKADQPKLDIAKAIKSIPNFEPTTEIDPNILFGMTEEKSLFLKYLPDTKQLHQDTVLLILLGYKLLRNLDEISTDHMTWCLEKSGCRRPRPSSPFLAVALQLQDVRPLEAAEVAQPCIENGYIIKTGLSRRANGYLRLTQGGANQAADLMADLIRRA